MTTTLADVVARRHDARVVPVIRELFADAATPVGLYRALANDRPGTFLLESAEQGGIWSRYSFIGVASCSVTEVLIIKFSSRIWLDTLQLFYIKYVLPSDIFSVNSNLSDPHDFYPAFYRSLSPKALQSALFLLHIRFLKRAFGRVLPCRSVCEAVLSRCTAALT